MAAWALTILLLAPGLEAELQRALANAGTPRSGLTVVVGRAGGPPLLAVAPGAARIPASNQKILTAAAALQLLGRDFSFQTKIARGPAGELVVVGDGDPNLSGRFFAGDPNRILRLMAKDVAENGVARVTGGLVLDASRFDGVYVHPDWPKDQLDRWYCAPVAALVYNDSCWDVTVRPGGAPGARARVEVQPALVRPALRNRCKTVAAGARHVVSIARAENADLAVGGTIRTTSAGVDGHVTVRDPVAFFGDAFLAALKAEGVEVKGGVRLGRVPDAKPLVAYRSDLARTLKVLLTNSQNLYGECLFKRMGEGSFPSGGDAVVRAVEAMGIDTAGLVVRDGSGLARTNRVPGRVLYAVLQKLRDEPRFVDALAAGGEGTLRRRYKALGPRIRAKTGTIRAVTCLSGYVTGKTGRRYVFVLLANGKSVKNARKLQDLIVQTLARSP